MKIPLDDTNRGQWLPMGYQLRQISNIDPFVIDQTVTVNFLGKPLEQERMLQQHADLLATLGGTAGFLTDEAPAKFPSREGVDAVLLSQHNELE